MKKKTPKQVNDSTKITSRGVSFFSKIFKYLLFLNCPDNANRINKYHIKKLRNNSKKLPKIRYKNDSPKVRQKKSNFLESVQFFRHFQLISTSNG